MNPRGPPQEANTAAGSGGTSSTAGTPGCSFTYMVKIAQHYHAYTMATQMKSGATQVYNSY